MLIICDTHILLFWADRQDRLTPAAKNALEIGRANGKLACSAISFWEIALLFRKNRLVLPIQQSPTAYMEDIVESLDLSILQLTPAIARIGRKRHCHAWRSGRQNDCRHRHGPSSAAHYCG